MPPVKMFPLYGEYGRLHGLKAGEVEKRSSELEEEGAEEEKRPGRMTSVRVIGQARLMPHSLILLSKVL